MTRAKSKGAKKGGDRVPAVQLRRGTRGRAIAQQTSSSTKARSPAATREKKRQTARKNRSLPESSANSGATVRSERSKAKQRRITAQKKTKAVEETAKIQTNKQIVLRGIDRLRELEKAKGKKSSTSPDTSMVTRQVRKRLAEAAGIPSKKVRSDENYHSTSPSVQTRNASLRDKSDPKTTVTSKQAAARKTRQRGVRVGLKQRTNKPKNNGAKTKRGKTAGSKTRRDDPTTNDTEDEVESETDGADGLKGNKSKAAVLRKLVERLDIKNKQKLLDATRNLRIHFCNEITSVYHRTGFYNRVTEQLLQLGVVSKLVAIFRKEEMTSQLRYEACWILNNIAGSVSSHTREIFQADIIPDLVAMASIEEDDPAREIALATLGNISGDCAEYRDAVLDSGIVSPLINILRTSTRRGTLNDAVDLVGNLAREHGVSGVDIQKVIPLLEPLKRHLDDDAFKSSVTRSACWAVQRIAKQTCSSHVGELSERGENSICQLLVNLCSDAAYNVIDAALAALGSVVSGNSDRTQAAIDAGALEKFSHLLDTNRNTSILERTLFALSNITAGTKDQLEATIKSEIIPKVLSIIDGLESKGKREAVLVIQNFAWNGNASQVRYLIDIGAIAAVCNVLSPGNAIMVLEDALQCIRIIIKSHASFRKEIVDAGVVLKLTTLLKSSTVNSLRSDINNLITDCQLEENDS